MRDKVLGSTSLLRVSLGKIFEAALPSLSFNGGTDTFNRSAALESTNRSVFGTLCSRTVLNSVAPPNECPSGTTSPPAMPSTCVTKAATSSVHWDHLSTCPRRPALLPWPRRSTANVPNPYLVMACAKRSYRRAWSPSPCTTANVNSALVLGHARYESLVPSADSIVPSRARVPSAGKVPEASQDFERFLFSLEQRRRAGADAEQGISPLGTRRTLRVKPESRRIEEDPLALNFLDHGALRKDLLQRLAVR